MKEINIGRLIFLIILIIVVIHVFSSGRYQFFLQVKQDILQGRLPISQELAAELGSYAVQCEYLHLSDFLGKKMCQS